MPVLVKYEGETIQKKYRKITDIENKEKVVEIDASNCNMKCRSLKIRISSKYRCIF